MTGGIRIARFFGIEVRLDPSWFVVFFLVIRRKAVWYSGQDVVNQPIFERGFGVEPFVAIAIRSDLFDRLAGVFVHDLVHALSGLEHLLGEVHAAVARRLGPDQASAPT